MVSNSSSASLVEKYCVELLDRGRAAHRKIAGIVAPDVGLVLLIEFIVDFADDLLQRILDRHQAGNAAVFIHDDRHVIAIAAEFLQQHVDALGLRHEHRRSHALADVKPVLRILFAGEHAQQVLG